jgi:hypothetical protein
MALRIPILKGGLEQISAVQLQDIIAIPWADHKHEGIIEGITALLMKTWSWPLVVYSSWNKVLRENGIPVAGVLFGRNLNEDISTQVSPLINDWANAMADQVEPLARNMYSPVQKLLADIQLDVCECTAVPELKAATTEALEDLLAAVEEAFNGLRNDLHYSLDQNHRYFTTEMDVECPVAQAMKPYYQRALDPELSCPGPGVMNRQKLILINSMLTTKI